MTTVEAVEVSFNSFESPDESAKAMFSDFLVTPSQLSCGKGSSLHLTRIAVNRSRGL
jgi:hypothetical protein